MFALLAVLCFLLGLLKVAVGSVNLELLGLLFLALHLVVPVSWPGGSWGRRPPA